MTDPAHLRSRDLIVIGASAGGVGALPILIGALPSELPAAVLVVQHLPPQGQRHLVEILQRTSQLPVKWAAHGEPLERGAIAVGPPGMHLLVEAGRTLLREGARENHARPSINRLFRSAAAQQGNAGVGALLTGMLDDGVAGIEAIRFCGGVTIVQDPATAEYADLPRNAIACVDVDHVLPIEAIAPLIAQLAGQQVPIGPVPGEVLLHAELDRVETASADDLDRVGDRVQAMCPECGGPLWKLRGEAGLYRCYLGHATSGSLLVHDQDHVGEQALWNALRSIEETILTLVTLTTEASRRGETVNAARYRRRADDLREEATTVRRLLTSREYAWASHAAS